MPFKQGFQIINQPTAEFSARCGGKNMSVDKITSKLKKASDQGIAKQRIFELLDEQSFVEIGAFDKNRNDLAEAVCGFGTVDGQGVYVFSQNPEAMGGAMSCAQAEKILKIYDLAAKNGKPIIGIFDSKGGYVDDGADALHSFSKLINAASLLSGVVPQIAVVLGKCTGENAVLCSQFDITVMEQNATLSLNPASLYKNGQDVGTAETAAKNGTAHIAAKKENIAAIIRSILSIVPSNNLAPLNAYEGGEPTVCPVINAEFLDAQDKIHLSDDFGKSAETLLGRINGKPCGAVLTKDQKLDADSIVKISRFVRFCDCFSLPVVSIIDADRLENDKASETALGARLLAQLCSVYCEATTPKIAVISGRACGGIYSAFAAKGASADIVFAFPEAVISPLSPEGAAIVLYDDRLKNGESLETLSKEYVESSASVVYAAEKGLVDDIFSKSEVRQKLSTAIDMLDAKRETRPAKKHTDFPF